MINFKLFKGAELLVDFTEDVNKLTKEQEQMITQFDNENIVKYELVFNENVKVKEIHNLDNLKPFMIKSAIVTIQGVPTK